MTNLLAAWGQFYIGNELPLWSFASRYPCFTATWWAQLTYLHIPSSRVHLEKLTGSQIVMKFPADYGTRKLTTAFTNAHNLYLSWTRSIQSIPPHHTYWRSILILSSRLSLGLPSGLFPSGFPTKMMYASLLPHTCYIHFLFHSSRFDHPNNIWWRVQTGLKKHGTHVQNGTRKYFHSNRHYLLSHFFNLFFPTSCSKLWRMFINTYIYTYIYTYVHTHLTA